MEEHFRNKLKNHRVDWDKEELLGSLQQELAQNKAGANYKLLMLLPLLFLAVWWGFTESELTVKNSADFGTIASKEAAISKIENSETKTLAPVQVVNETEAIANSISNNFESKQSSKTTDAALLKQEKSKVEHSINTAISKSNLNEKEVKIFAKNKDFIIENEASADSISTAFYLQTPYNSTTLSANVDGSKNDLVSRSNQEIIKNVDFISPLAMIIISSEATIPSTLSAQKMDFPKSNKAKRLSNSIFASISIGAGFTNRTANFQSDNLDFLERLQANDATINPLMWFSNNVTVGYQHRSGWMLQFGLEKNKIKESFTYNYFETTVTTNTNGETMVVTELRKINHKNEHTYLSIPVEAGYRQSIGRANIFGTVGGSYAFNYSHQGRENQLFEDGGAAIITNPDFVLKNKIGLKLGLGAEYPLSRIIHGFVNIGYQRSPKVTWENKEQSYQSFSLGVGLKALISSGY